MFKKFLNLKNIVLLVIIAVLAVLIIEQQPVLNEKISSYDEALEASREVERLSDDQKLESDMASSATEEESYARSEGYIFRGEKVFQFED